MPDSVKDLKQKRDKVARQMRELNDGISEERSWKQEEKDQFSELKQELRDLDHRIEVEEELAYQDDVSRRSKEKNPEKRAGDPEIVTYDQAFEVWARSGYQELNSEQRSAVKRRIEEIRALGESTDSAGGYTVPDEFRSKLVELMKDYGGVASVCTVWDTSNGRVIPWTSTDGTNDMGAFIGENQEAGEQDLTFDPLEIGAKKITSNVIRIANELLQDTGIPMDSFLARRISSRIGRKEAHAIINGTGIGLENKGLALSVENTVPMATADDFNWKDINALKHSIDPAYRRSTSFKFGLNDSTLQVVEEMEDDRGRPLWLPSIIGGSPETILGVPYFIDQAIADAQDANKFMYAGDWSAFILRRVRYMALKRLVEKYAEYDQTGFVAFHRFDTALEDKTAIKALTFLTA